MTAENTNETNEASNSAEIDRMEGEIRAYEQLLAQSDYKALKHADGALSDEEYAETRKLRAQWRQAINELQAKEQALLNPPAVADDPADSAETADDAAETAESTERES